MVQSNPIHQTTTVSNLIRIIEEVEEANPNMQMEILAPIQRTNPIKKSIESNLDIQSNSIKESIESNQTINPIQSRYSIQSNQRAN